MNDKAPRPIGHKLIRYAFALAITILALWLSFRNVDGPALKTGFSRANYFWVALAVLNSVFSVYALGWRWRILLDPKDRIPMGALFRLNILSQCANILMPARAGDFLRAYMTSTVSRASGGFALGTIVIERFFDFMAFVFFWMLMPVALAIQTRFPSTWIAALICGLALCAVWALARHPQIVARGGRAISRLLPEKFRAPVQQSLSQGLEAFAAMRKPRTVFYLSAITPCRDQLIPLQGVSLRLELLARFVRAVGRSSRSLTAFGARPDRNLRIRRNPGPVRIRHRQERRLELRPNAPRRSLSSEDIDRVLFFRKSPAGRPRAA